ncbi:WbqC family protein [soil metagenome]
MATIAIMQPYVFPYIGYFQLIGAVDKFIFYNDVNFIKKGWIHRNRILLNGTDHLFTIPCTEISQNKRICDTRLAFDVKERNKLIQTISQAYKRAPFFETIFPLVESILVQPYEFIDELAMQSVKDVSSYLQLNVSFEESKNRYGNEELKKADRLIDICLTEGIKSYINPSGGQSIYTHEYFNERGVNLQFINALPVSYSQFGETFVPWLSILDVLMFNDRNTISKLLTEYELN